MKDLILQVRNVLPSNDIVREQHKLPVGRTIRCVTLNNYAFTLEF